MKMNKRITFRNEKMRSFTVFSRAKKILTSSLIISKIQYKKGQNSVPFSSLYRFKAIPKSLGYLEYSFIFGAEVAYGHIKLAVGALVRAVNVTAERNHLPAPYPIIDCAVLNECA